MKYPKLETLEWLINGDGDITIGAISPLTCTAIASDQKAMLTALVSRDGESLFDLLVHLEDAVNEAYDEELFIDEINDGPDYRV